MDSSEVAESFRSLLLRHRGRTGLIQRELADRAGVSRRSVQDWEAGMTLPTAERLQALIRALMQAGGLTVGREMLEARELWSAAEREGQRMNTPFDDEWFADLAAPQHVSTSAPAGVVFQTANAPQPGTGNGERAHDWGEAPDTTGFVGRGEELALLQRWVMQEHARLAAVLGMGGIGKTSLAAMLAQTVAPNFELVYWRSLRNAPPVGGWLAGAIAFLSDQQVVPPRSESEGITALLQLLRARRCLLVLDNSETLFEPGQREGRYRDGMDGYGRVLQAVGEAPHLSCLMLTSREAPPELALLTGARTLQLHGLGPAEVRVLVADKQLVGDAQTWLSLVERYGGNGLALKIVGETIRQVYDGDVAAFLSEAIATYGTVFGGIRRLLDVQAERLSPTERDVLTRMAVEREPITLAELSADMGRSVGRGTVIEAVEGLRRRSLVERSEGGARFTLQSLVLEYVTDRLVESIADEIRRGEPVVLIEQPLIKAQAKDYVRQTQERLIAAPILQRLNATQQAEAATEQRLLALLEPWRGLPTSKQGYGPGNVVNLLRLLRGDLRRMNLSRLSIRQAYLHETEAQDASLAGAHIAETVLAEAFGYATAVALSADGALLAAATPTGEVRVWRLADRMPQLTLQGDTSAVWSVAFSGDGRSLACGSVDGTVRVWETASGLLIATLHGHTGGVRGIALSADGQRVASGSVDGSLRLWEVPGRRLLVTVQGHTSAIWVAALSEDGQLAASGGDDGIVRLWETASGTLLATLQGHTGGVWGLAFAADGRLVASSSLDGTVRVWDVASGRLLNTLLGHTSAVCGLGVSGDGQLVASGSWDGTVRLWEAESGKLLATLQGHTGAVWGTALSRDGRLVATSGDDGTIRLWETASTQRLTTLRGRTGAVWGMALSRDGRLAASSGDDRIVRLWDAESGRLLSTLEGHSGLVWTVALSGDGRLVASGSVDATVRLWDATSGQPLVTLHGHTGGVRAVDISRDGQLVASGGDDETVRLWDTRSGQPLATLQGHAGTVYDVALSWDGRMVASGGDDGRVRLWERSSGQLIAELQGHTGMIQGLALSGDGRLAASASVDGTVRLWEVHGRQPLATLQGHTAAVWSVALSGDGRLVASGGWDNTVRLWDAASGQLLATLQGHTGKVSRVALSEDGQLLVSGSDDGTVRVWDTRSGASLRTLRGDRTYERTDITGLTGVTSAQGAALLQLGALDESI